MHVSIRILEHGVTKTFQTHRHNTWFMMGQSSSNRLIPRNYKKLERLGAGSFGVVVKCMKKDTKEIVALKIPYRGSLADELALMTFFKRNNLDKWNIVRFIGPITLTDNRTALAYESLDVTLNHYINTNTGLNVRDVRSVVQQLASALNALESIKVIHADIKLDNIMLVDRNAQPLRVKLIDFGMALPSSSAKQGQHRQVLNFRAPEIFLGLPFSESIDMWSLGVVMARILLGRSIFPGYIGYVVLQHIVELLGVPSDHLLTAGMHSNRYFVKGHSSKWRLKTYEEFWGPWLAPDNGSVCRINNPDSLEMWSMEQLNVVEAAEKEECIDLLKAMLRMDSNERITPSQVLAHPFIRRGTLQPSSDSIPEASAQPPQIPYSTSMEYKNWLGSDSECHKPAAAQISPGVILVQPAPPECCLALVEDSSQSEESCSIREASAPPPQTPSVSTSWECRSWLGSDSECHESDAAQTPPGVILVQPAPPECRLALAEDNRQCEKSCAPEEEKEEELVQATLGLDQGDNRQLQQCGCCGVLEIPYEGVILVQPAPPECRLALVEDSRLSETSSPSDLLEELCENSSVELPSHSAEGSDMQQEDTEFTDITPVPQKRKKRKTKNWFKRLRAWNRETVSSCCSVDVVES
ncbi:hypothetical protein ABVT39_008200 [Epinephelus coioides]